MALVSARSQDAHFDQRLTSTTAEKMALAKANKRDANTPTEQHREAALLAGAADGWQDTIFEAIMDAVPQEVWSALEASPSSALDCQLQRREMGGVTFFVFHERIYTADASALRETLGSSFLFENEGVRARVADWLEMIDAKAGDTLLHLVMRLNGVDDMVKARCAVEILGRGASFEIENCDRELCSMIDSTFKLAWLKELPAWKTRRAERERKQELNAAAERRRMAERDRREQGRRDMADNRRAAEAAARKTLVDAEEERNRRSFHQALERTLMRLDQREQRQAKSNPAWRELITDIRAIPKQVELWFSKGVGFG